MEQDQQPLEEEDFDLAATRPPLTFGLPHTLTVSLLTAGMLILMFFDTGDFVNDTIGDVVMVGGLFMVGSAAKILLRSDYHGWDIFLSWCRLDARLLDTKEWGGAHISSFPLRSVYRCEVRGND